MRLTLATSALLALPASGAASHEFLLSQRNHQGITKRASNTSAGQKRVLKHMLHGAQQRGNRPRLLGKGDLFANAGVLKNKNHRTLQEGIACDPTADAVDLDTGIIQCGTEDLICTPDATNTTVGVCTSEDLNCTTETTTTTAGVCTSVGGGGRTLQEYTSLEGTACDPTADAIIQCGTEDLDLTCIPGATTITTVEVCTTPPSYLCGLDDCDCSEFDVTTGTGTIDCVYCQTLDDFRMTFEGTIVTEENAFVSNSFCITLIKPYEQSYCVSRAYDQEDPSGGTCEITVGDEPCTSCAFGDCPIFDCANTEGNAQTGDLCEIDILPIADYIERTLGEEFNSADVLCEETQSSTSSPATASPTSSPSAPISAGGYSRGASGTFLAASMFATMVIGYLIV
jgi:hypothetical protein